MNLYIGRTNNAFHIILAGEMFIIWKNVPGKATCASVSSLLHFHLLGLSHFFSPPGPLKEPASWFLHPASNCTQPIQFALLYPLLPTSIPSSGPAVEISLGLLKQGRQTTALYSCCSYSHISLLPYLPKSSLKSECLIPTLEWKGAPCCP